MHSSSSLPYRTATLKMSKVNFECMVNNLAERIRTMNMQLYFKTKNEMDNFITAAKRAEEREGADMQLSSEQEDKIEEGKAGEVIGGKAGEVIGGEGGGEGARIDEGVDSVVIEETFQKSILLRMHFTHRLREMEERLKVKFMVVPQKVKISGCSRTRVEEAQEEYSELVNEICLEPIDRFGREVFLSKGFRAQLQGGRIHLVEILKKYYFWFLKSQAKDPHSILQKVFFKTKHALYPLRRLSLRQKEQLLAGGRATVVLGDASLAFSGGAERVTDQLFVCLRARLFQGVVSQRLNQMEDREERQVQLAEDRKSLILHMDAEEQIQIQTETIEEEYNRFQFLHLLFPDSADMQAVANALNASPLSSAGFRKDKSKQDLLMWQANEKYLCLAFAKQKKDADIEEQIASHPLTRIINALPQQLCNFRLGLFDAFQLPETEQWAKLTSQRDRAERLTLIGVKSFTRGNFQKLARLLVEGKLSAQNLAKAKEAKNDKPDVSADVSMDMSRQINESTQLLMMNNASREEENQLDVSISEVGKQVLTSELVSANSKFQAYSFFLQEDASEREKKFASDVQVPTKETRPFTKEDYLKKLMEATSFKFKLFRGKLPKRASEVDLEQEANKMLQARPELGHLNRWVTVFCGSKSQELCEAGKSVRVVKVQKNHKIKQGWLLTTNPLFLAEFEELPPHHYEPLCFCKKLE